MLKRNLDKLTILTADKGYDWWLLDQRLRADGDRRLGNPNSASVVPTAISCKIIRSTINA
jgi:hypothetical protein